MVYNRPNSQPVSPKKMEQDRKIRREIANSNERRRMQSINAGFNSLRTMLPKNDGEKLSKAAILQHTAEYIDQLEQHKTRLMQEIDEIKKLVNPELLPTKYDQSLSSSWNKRIKLESASGEVSNSDSSDEGIRCNPSPKNQTNERNGISNGSGNQLTSNNHIINGATPITNGDETATADELRSELIKVRRILDKERKLRMQLEEKVRLLEAQIYPARIKEIAHQVQLQFQSSDKNDGTNYYTLPEDQAEDGSLVVDNEQEVIAETIEIETHSCPGSPNAAALFASTQQPVISPVHYTAQVTTDDGNGLTTGTTTLLIQSGMDDQCEYMSDGETQDALIDDHAKDGSTHTGEPITLRLLDRATADDHSVKIKSEMNGESNKKSSRTEKQAKKLKTNPPAAIALPIDMPFICDTEPTTEEIVTHVEEPSAGGEVSVNQLGEVISDADGIPTTVTLQIVSDGSVYEAGGSAANSGRNLDTIVEAIRHLEGDHLFHDVSGRQNDQSKVVTDDGKGNATTVVLKQMNDRELSNLIAAGQTAGTYQLTTSSNGGIRTVLTVSPEQIGAIRQQVIQCTPTSSARPGVIVSNHP